MAVVDFFLKIDGIEGDSKDDKHQGEIEIDSFSWGETQSGTMAFGGGGGAGKVKMQSFHFTSKVSKASPWLAQASANGQHIKKVVLTVRKAGKNQQEYYKVTLTDVLVSSYRSMGAPGQDLVPLDDVSLDFAKIEFEYKEQKGDGSLGAPILMGWDLKANKAI
jgi:type VI secretion system secreted protein Hcp